jgi:outer membrane protein assembly factor BamB
MVFRALLIGFATCCGTPADWPALHGGATHTGFVEGAAPRDLKLQWVRHFEEERLGTAMEPIIGGTKVFIATHQGKIHALDTITGDELWRFEVDTGFLQSPAYAKGFVVAADVAGRIFCLEAKDGRLLWKKEGIEGGFSAAPVISGGVLLIGSRGGAFLALALPTGGVLWQHDLGAPVRQTAAADWEHVYVTSEDLKVHCLELKSGKLLWTSEPLKGQTARDYYPQIIEAGEKKFVVVRTNPVLSMGNQIGRDRTMLARNANIDASDWRKLDAYTKSTNALGNPELWKKEQTSIITYEQEHPESRTFFVLDAETGKEARVPPILWTGGCQGVGQQPALTSDGRLLVMFRSTYGNWNLGVAPLVALGLYDLVKNEITPVRHTGGMQPRWNTFWGTADESQNFTVIGDTVLIVHQGTLSGFNLKTSELVPIWGERDTYGGFRSPPWARNEWHGPARGAVAVEHDRLYWITGSRLLCLAPGESLGKTEDIATETRNRQTFAGHAPISSEKLKSDLAKAVTELVSTNWAPLYVEPGLAGREFFFDDSGDLLEALAYAWKFLPTDLQTKARALLADAWEKHPPFSKECAFSLKEGARREMFWVPEEALTRLGQDKMAHPFGNTYAIWLYAERCGEWERILKHFSKIREAYEDWTKSNWKVDPQKGGLYANPYLASLLAFSRIAAQANESSAAAEAKANAERLSDSIIRWWKRAADSGTLRNFNGSGELDPFINSGDAFSFCIAPHRHKIALFHDMTPEVAALVRERASDAFQKIWSVFSQLYVTWPYVGEERQVHYGENFIDPPDLAMDAFKTALWAARTKSEIVRQVDIPFCRADLFYITKLALALDAKP